MSSKDVSRQLHDIIVNAERIERYIADQDGAAFAETKLSSMLRSGAWKGLPKRW